jgi:hypothetical protein
MNTLIRSFPLLSVAVLAAACADTPLPSSPLLDSHHPVLSTVPSAVGDFRDGFEGTAVHPFWSVQQQYGTVSISPSQAHNGATSVMFSSMTAPPSSGPNMSLTHDFPQPVKGTFSVQFYDAAPGQETLYEQMTLYDSQRPGILATIGTQDFDSQCYMVRFDDGGQHGPNANCGLYPQASTTNVRRTLGWHRLAVRVLASRVEFLIDGQRVFTWLGNYTFDRVALSVTGPYWRPLTTAFFDSFVFDAN